MKIFNLFPFYCQKECQSGLDGGDIGDEEGAFVVEVTELTTTGFTTYKIKDGIKGRTLIERTIRVGYEEKRHTPLFQYDFPQ